MTPIISHWENNEIMHEIRNIWRLKGDSAKKYHFYIYIKLLHPKSELLVKNGGNMINATLNPVRSPFFCKTFFKFLFLTLNGTF